MRIGLHVLHYYADYCLSILASRMREKAISGTQDEAVREVSKRKSKPWTYIHLYLVVVLIHMSYKMTISACFLMDMRNRLSAVSSTAVSSIKNRPHLFR